MLIEFVIIRIIASPVRYRSSRGKNFLLTQFVVEPIISFFLIKHRIRKTYLTISLLKVKNYSILFFFNYLRTILILDKIYGITFFLTIKLKTFLKI
jgi:hypothetical protein